MSKELLLGVLCYLGLHVAVWFGTVAQFVDGWRDKAFYIMLLVSIPASLFSYYGTRYVYTGLGDTAWGARFVGSGTSYLVFPLLTWFYLSESMFTLKTGICILLSFAIIAVQVWVD